MLKWVSENAAQNQGSFRTTETKESPQQNVAKLPTERRKPQRRPPHQAAQQHQAVLPERSVQLVFPALVPMNLSLWVQVLLVMYLQPRG